MTVKTAVAEARQMDKAIYVTGSLNPDETVSVSFEVAGRLAAVNADFGQSVRKGDVLAELDHREATLQVERSRAALDQALARIGLDATQENAKPESTPAVRQAVAQMEDARSKYENALKLAKTGDVSQEHATELEKAYKARWAAVEFARDDMHMQLASVDGIRTDLKLAQKRLGDTVVRAPFDGSITQKLVSAGQYIKENTAVLTIVKTNPMRLRVDIPENAAGTVRVGTMLNFTTDAVADAKFAAVVREMNPSLDSKSRSLTVEARLAQNDSRLRPGMFVQVELVLARGAGVVVVPKEAIYTLAGLNKVFIVRDGKVLERRIAPGQEAGGWVEVPGDLVRAGDRVAVTELPLLVEGIQVKTTS